MANEQKLNEKIKWVDYKNFKSDNEQEQTRLEKIIDIYSNESFNKDFSELSSDKERNQVIKEANDQGLRFIEVKTPSSFYDFLGEWYTTKDENKIFKNVRSATRVDDKSFIFAVGITNQNWFAEDVLGCDGAINGYDLFNEFIHESEEVRLQGGYEYLKNKGLEKHAKTLKPIEKQYKPVVNIYLKRDRLEPFEIPGQEEKFCTGRVFNGSHTKDGVDISYYTYIFPEKKIKDIVINDNANDKTKEFLSQKQKGGFIVITFYEDTKIKLREPWDCNNRNKELKTITITAKELNTAQNERKKHLGNKEKSQSRDDRNKYTGVKSVENKTKNKTKDKTK